MIMRDHPVAALFPQMTAEEYESLKADIAAHGQQHPIVFHDGMILDGRTRLRACEELGIEPQMRQWEPKDCGSPVAYVASMNLHRRHLTASQRGYIAAELTERKTGNFSGTEATEKQRELPGMSLQGAAAVMQVTERTAQDARTVLRQGTEAEKEAVRTGKASVASIAKSIRRGASPSERTAPPKQKETQNRKTAFTDPEASIHAAAGSTREAMLIQRVQMAVAGLTEMPEDASYVVAVVRSSRFAKPVEDRMFKASAWLKEFCEEWNKARTQEPAQVQVS
jgi:ParB-like nuclease family protein